jgi:hypothetical protein
MTEYLKCDIPTERTRPEKQRFRGRDLNLALINLAPCALLLQGRPCGIGLHGSSIPARSAVYLYSWRQRLNSEQIGVEELPFYMKLFCCCDHSPFELAVNRLPNCTSLR